MAAREYGQYSLVSYVHRLRGERVNLGVLVWHPRFGSKLSRPNNLKRVSCIDRDADLDRLERDFGVIQQTLDDWSDRELSPLEALSAQFRYDLVVSEPLFARITDVNFISERLMSSLIAPDRPRSVRDRDKILDRAFRKEFSQFARHSLSRLGGVGGRFEFSDRRGDTPIWIAAKFRYNEILYIWRTLAYHISDGIGRKREKAKAMDAENNRLRSSPPYDEARLNLAVRVPPGDNDIDDPQVKDWLGLHADKVLPFHNRPTFDYYDPRILLDA
jgi:hypothetical protein